ncbi:SDR family oxidoreductase [Sphingobium algorifonticola]|uniref:SDR family oxidoreductase n=1 Tax=Sphingobium algorifonticola TaxID=2008318 RepID=A0A437J427_9SPHN|nr:SDR family oxidoreductase [Sphingobium algorifonticola]RVT39433.1 SDR family oxidoreductase [Sphingobium algorifonticola]
MGRLTGKTAIVTAAGQGIGRATAERFIAEGARVVAVDLNEDALSTLEGCETQVLDVLDKEAIERLVERFGSVDILFNCVGIVDAGTILTTTEEVFDRAYAINVKSAYAMIRAFLPGMIAKGRGSIVNVASVAGSIIAVADRFAYGTTKAALIGLTKSVALDFVQQGIRCNAICPGTVQSPSLDQRLEATGDAEAARRQFMARQPMGRIGQPEEIAELAVYLASDAASFTTGTVNIIDGGWANA